MTNTLWKAIYNKIEYVEENSFEMVNSLNVLNLADSST